MNHKEYLHRNLIHAASIGVHANLISAVARLNRTKRPPKWLVDLLNETIERVDRIHPEVAKWRDAAPDALYTEKQLAQD